MEKENNKSSRSEILTIYVTREEKEKILKTLKDFGFSISLSTWAAGILMQATERATKAR